MDLRSRRNDAGVRIRTLLTLKRGHLLAAAVGIMVAVAACGPAATGVQRTNAETPGSATANGTSGAGTHAAGSTSTSASGASHGSAGAGGPGSGTTSTSTPGSTTPGATPTPGARSTPRATATPQPTPAPTPRPGTRNKYLWPFASTSIWNMPIGRNAVYVPAHIAAPTQQTLTADQDIIIMEPTAPLTLLAHNGAGWGGGNRCTASGISLTSVPIPTDFTVPSNGANNALAVVMADGQTVIQGQPFARCSPGGPATSLALAPSANLYTNGILGAHGGSGLSSLGGTIRLNQLVPGGVIRHALKVNVDAAVDLYPSPGFVWPAVRHDSCAPGCYGGTVRSLEMGSLLAIPTSVNINALGLETAPARMLAWTLQNYGAYVVDNAARSVFSIETEDGPNGSVVNQFQQTWGYPFQAPAGSDTPWSHDINVIIANLAVVANNGPLSVGGGGTPLQPLAPPIGN
jgi:hypothetical protein